MRIINWLRTINLSRIFELRHFTMQNIVFYLAVIALSLFMFELLGGWGALFVTGFEAFQRVDLVKFGFSVFFFLLAVIMLAILIVIGIAWIFSKKPRPVSTETKISGTITISNAIIAVCELIILLTKGKGRGNNQE